MFKTLSELFITQDDPATREYKETINNAQLHTLLADLKSTGESLKDKGCNNDLIMMIETIDKLSKLNLSGDHACYIYGKKVTLHYCAGQFKGITTDLGWANKFS